MSYLVYGVLAAVSYGIYNFLVGKAAGKINQLVGVSVLYLTAAVLAGTIALFKTSTEIKTTLSSAGIWLAIAAGIFAGTAEIFYFITFVKNPNVSVVLPIVFTVTVITGVLLGIFFNRESLTIFKIAGISLALVALFLLSK